MSNLVASFVMAFYIWLYFNLSKAWCSEISFVLKLIVMKASVGKLGDKKLIHCMLFLYNQKKSLIGFKLFVDVLRLCSI